MCACRCYSVTVICVVLGVIESTYSVIQYEDVLASHWIQNDFLMLLLWQTVTNWLANFNKTVIIKKRIIKLPLISMKLSFNDLAFS